MKQCDRIPKKLENSKYLLTILKSFAVKIATAVGFNLI